MNICVRLDPLKRFPLIAISRRSSSLISLHLETPNEYPGRDWVELTILGIKSSFSCDQLDTIPDASTA